MSRAYCTSCEKFINDENVVHASLDAYADMTWDYDEFCEYCGEEITWLSDEAIIQ